MPKTANKKQLIVYLAFLIMLLLSSINISIFLNRTKSKDILKNTKVLGAETQISKDQFWQEFLSKNSNYIPGWIETGRLDRAKLIDPNYSISP